MPHAALWVVQPWFGENGEMGDSEFQCRTRLCGWCSSYIVVAYGVLVQGFNAARGFVGGAASSLSALFPLGGKSTFGKSPEIREF